MSRYITRKNVPDFKVNGLWVKAFNPEPYVKVTTHAAALFYSVRRRTVGSDSKVSYYEGTLNLFTDFQSFVEWCQTQIGYCSLDDNGKMFHLDKDVLANGNGKAYSPETCVFVPVAINNLLQVNRKCTKGLPTGVALTSRGERYSATIRRGAMNLSTVYKEFTTPEAAFAFFKIEKEKYVKLVAEHYKGRVDPRVYKALMEYEVKEEQQND